MADDSKQKTLDADTSRKSKNFQKRINEKYNSDDFIEKSIGYWGKFFSEAAIVSIPLSLFLLLPMFAANYFNIRQISLGNALILWVSVSMTITLSTWCFSSTQNQDGGEGEG